MIDSGVVVILLCVMFSTVILWGTLLLLSRDITKIPLLLERLQVIEKCVGTSQVPSQEEWRTTDGRYKANSFDELLMMMIHDPNTPLSADQIAAIKSIFEQYMGADSDEPDEDWKL